MAKDGAYDFIEEIIKKNEEYGFRIGPNQTNFLVERIVPENLDSIISRLRAWRSLLSE